MSDVQYGIHSVAVVNLTPAHIATTAAKNHASTVVHMRRLEDELARTFAELDKFAAALLESGTRAEPDWDALPLCFDAHNRWMSERVGPAPTIRQP